MKKVLRKEIWLAKLNPTLGREQAGIRPVLIISNNYFNRGFAQLVYAIPITSKDKNIRSHLEIMPPEGGLKMSSYIVCEAMRSISKQRMIKRLGIVSAETIEDVQEMLEILLDF